MKTLKTNAGSVLIFATLMITLLLILVGMGVDTGWLTYVRSQGQRAVDAAALAGASAIATGDPTQVKSRIEALNSTNDYVGSGGVVNNKIDGTVPGPNVTPVFYNPSTQTITEVASILAANGIRVALEEANPYTGATPARAMNTPVFLTPLLNLFGAGAPSDADVNVSAVAAIQAIPGLPIVLGGCPLEPMPPDPDAPCEGPCNTSDGITTCQKCTLLKSPTPKENSGYTSYWFGSANAALMKQMVRNNLTCDSIPAVTTDTSCINLNNGEVNSVRKEIDKVYGGDLPQPFLIPVVDKSTKFNQCEPIEMFARITITEIKDTGSPKYIKGTIQCPVSPFTATDAKCVKPVLVRDTASGM